MRKVEKILRSCQDNWIWLLILLLTDLLFAGFLWLMDARSFGVLAGLWTAFSVILWAAAVYFLYKREEERERWIADFLDQPDQEREGEVCGVLSFREKHFFQVYVSHMREAKRALKEQETRLEEYEEYIESWAHEVKTPLALMMLMLDNRRDEMGQEVHHRLEYSRKQMQGYVEQILFYARLRAVHKDYLFERVSLAECCAEVLEQFETFFTEHDFSLVNRVQETEVVTDRRSFCFLLSQVAENAVKYRKSDGTRPQIWLETGKDREERIFLSIMDNGIGVKACDLPFLFDKGFTSDPDGLRRKATGMGLYLVRQLADDLNIQVLLTSQYGEGFQIKLLFPAVDRGNGNQRLTKV